jgi:hypothetical protein
MVWRADHVHRYHGADIQLLIGWAQADFLPHGYPMNIRLIDGPTYQRDMDFHLGLAPLSTRPNKGPQNLTTNHSTLNAIMIINPARDQSQSDRVDHSSSSHRVVSRLPGSISIPPACSLASNGNWNIVAWIFLYILHIIIDEMLPKCYCYTHIILC